MRTKLVVATYNVKKRAEILELLADMPIEVLSLDDFPGTKEVEEDGATFGENAEKKALGYAKQIGCLTLGEDSGLAVDCLNGEPGIYSARYAGEAKDDLANCKKVLERMKGVPEAKRAAAFVSAVSLATPERVIATVEGKVEGRIANEMRGTNGFGYDPLFFYPEFGTTFGQVDTKKKHSVSHRGKALQQIKPEIKKILSNI